MPSLNPTPDVSSKYGAPMGRGNNSYYLDKEGEPVEITVTENADPFYLQRIHLDNGGYDAGGAYWGHYQQLYYFEYSRVSDIYGYVRGRDRDAAKRAVIALHPNARFFK